MRRYTCECGDVITDCWKSLQKPFVNLNPWRLTACTPGSAPGPTLRNEYGKPFTGYFMPVVKLVSSVRHVVVGIYQLLFAVIFTIGIWFRIDIVYIFGYGILYSVEWLALYSVITPQVISLTYLRAYSPS